MGKRPKPKLIHIEPLTVQVDAGDELLLKKIARAYSEITGEGITPEILLRGIIRRGVAAELEKARESVKQYKAQKAEQERQAAEAAADQARFEAARREAAWQTGPFLPDDEASTAEPDGVG